MERAELCAEIEVTGSHTQFYDKFNIRYYITQLFKLVWSNPTHRESLKRESQCVLLPPFLPLPLSPLRRWARPAPCSLADSFPPARRVNFDRYVRFVNLLMNDTTYLLDDALVHLGKISETQRAMDDTAAWAALPAAERQEKEKLLRQYESQVKSDLDLGHESLRLLKLFTHETKEPFLTPEIVDRLAAMLDMNLSVLAGPRCQDLKVRDPEKLKFRPKELLADVLACFLELGPHLEFQSAVAKDGRSYSRDLFNRAGRIAAKTAIRTPDELQALSAFVDKVEAIKTAEEEDEALGDLPDEFLGASRSLSLALLVAIESPSRLTYCPTARRPAHVRRHARPSPTPLEQDDRRPLDDQAALPLGRDRPVQPPAAQVGGHRRRRRAQGPDRRLPRRAQEAQGGGRGRSGGSGGGGGGGRG